MTKGYGDHFSVTRGWGSVGGGQAGTMAEANTGKYISFLTMAED